MAICKAPVSATSDAHGVSLKMAYSEITINRNYNKDKMQWKQATKT